MDFAVTNLKNPRVQIFSPIHYKFALLIRHIEFSNCVQKFSISSKLNLDLYYHKLNIILLSKPNYNSKFQEFEIIRTLKISKAPNLDQKILKINDYENPTKKEGRKKKDGILGGHLLFALLLFF